MKMSEHVELQVPSIEEVIDRMIAGFASEDKLLEERVRQFSAALGCYARHLDADPGKEWGAKFLEGIQPFFKMLLDPKAGFSDSDDAVLYISSAANFIKDIQNQELILAARPFLARALFPASQSPDNFGRLACDYLDMDGEVEDLINPVKLILKSQQGKSFGGSFRSPEEHLARHLCCEGFIAFLNHPRLKESSDLTNLLRPFAGQIIPDQTDDTPSVCKNNTRILVLMQGNDVWVAWGQTLGGMYCRSIWNLECLSGRYSETASGVAPVIRSLLKKMGQDNLLKKAAENALLAIDLSQGSGRELV